MPVLMNHKIIIIIIQESNGIWQFVCMVTLNSPVLRMSLISQRTCLCFNLLTWRNTPKYKCSRLLCLGNLFILINLKGF